MNIFELIIIAICLAMDAFAASICKGATSKKINIKYSIIVGLYFGFFQGIMPLIGYFLGKNIIDKIEIFDHYIILILLIIIGITMIKDSNNDEEPNDKIDIKTMIFLSLATSIDAMSVGITFSFIKIPVIYSCILIAIITFIISTLGVIIGTLFGKKYKSISCIIGGFVLILIGIKIFLEHLGIL